MNITKQFDTVQTCMASEVLPGYLCTFAAAPNAAVFMRLRGTLAEKLAAPHDWTVFVCLDTGELRQEAPDVRAYRVRMDAHAAFVTRAS